MTDICVKIYRCHLLFAREYWFAVAVVVVAVIVLIYLHKWCQVIIGLGLGAPIHYLEQYRSSETIGLRPKDILLLNKTKQTFYQVQYIWKETRILNTTQSVYEPLSEPMMVRCVLKVPKFNHDIFGKRAFTVCRPLSWNLGYAMKLKHSSEP